MEGGSEGHPGFSSNPPLTPPLNPRPAHSYPWTASPPHPSFRAIFLGSKIYLLYL